MQVKAQLKSYEALDLQITLTAPVEDWRAAAKQLQLLTRDGHIAWPLSGLTSCIDQMLLNLDKTHFDVLTRTVPAA